MKDKMIVRNDVKLMRNDKNYKMSIEDIMNVIKRNYKRLC